MILFSHTFEFESSYQLAGLNAWFSDYHKSLLVHLFHLYKHCTLFFLSLKSSPISLPFSISTLIYWFPGSSSRSYTFFPFIKCSRRQLSFICHLTQMWQKNGTLAFFSSTSQTSSSFTGFDLLSGFERMLWAPLLRLDAFTSLYITWRTYGAGTQNFGVISKILHDHSTLCNIYLNIFG